ncbi:MAG: aminotransferase class IV, partial [Halospina sp.]
MSMADRDGLIWLDGELVPWRDAKVHVLTHTLHYGMGCFEGVRAYSTDDGPAIFRLQDHTQRLFNSAHILNMKMPYDQETLNDAQRLVVRENGLASAYIRPMVFLGS